jgi:hypothetical protein
LEVSTVQIGAASSAQAQVVTKTNYSPLMVAWLVLKEELPQSTEIVQKPETLKIGNDQFLASKHVSTVSIAQINTPGAGAVVLTKNLVVAKDPENKSVHIIGGVLLCSALAYYCCFIIFCCWRRRKKEKKKKEESEMMDAQQTRPVWMNGGFSGEDPDE